MAEYVYFNAELTADLVGDYLFTDSDFIRRLSTEHRNVFQKIYDEIKYLCKVATAGSKEARDLEKVKRAFEEAYKAEGAQKNTATEGGVRYSITKDMSESERYEALKDKELFVVDSADLTPYETQLADIDAVPPRAKSKAESTIYALAEDLGVLRKPMKTPEIKFEFQISKNNGLKKSLNNQLDYGGSYGDLARALINLDQIVPNALLIDAYTKDRYADTTRENKRFEGGYVLLGGFQDGEFVVPVKLTIKKETGETGNLYVVVAMTKIKRTSVMGSEGTTSNEVEQPLPVTGSRYSIQQIVSKINAEDADFLKYLPDSFLSEEQQKAKQHAILKEENKVAQYRYSLSPANEDIAPIGNFDIYGKDVMLETAQEDIVPVREELATTAAENTAIEDIAPVREDVKAKKESEPRTAKILVEEPKARRKQRSLLSLFKTNFLDKGAVFEDLSLKTKNRELMGKWNYTLSSEARAQRLIGHGDYKKIVKIYSFIFTSPAFSSIMEGMKNEMKGRTLLCNRNISVFF